MQPNWEYVKKTTLWSYDELIKKLNAVIVYPAIWQAYNHDLAFAAVFARRLFADKNIAAGEYPAQILDTISRLELTGVDNWGSLLSRVAMRDDCLAFIAGNGLIFEEFIDVLNYLLRFAFPFQTASRELLDHDKPDEMACYEILKRHKLMNSFDILEQGRTDECRRSLSERTGLRQDFVDRLAHRADIARLPYVRRKTILHICGASYDTLARIAAADLAQMESDMDAYFRRTQGKPWENYRSVIVLKGMVTAAQALPVILEG